MGRLLLGITGGVDVGKTTTAMHLSSRFGFVAMSFAAPLKLALKAITDTDFLSLTQEEKETEISWLGITRRELMQKVGTEGFRAIDKNFWIKVAARNLEQMLSIESVVFSDVRFENEAAFIRSRGGVVVHLNRLTTVSKKTAAHSSEAGVSFLKGIDLRINNNTTRDVLFSKLDSLVSALAPEVSGFDGAA